MKLKRILFSIAVLVIIITASVNCFAFGGVNTLGYEKETCTLEKEYHLPAYTFSTMEHMAVYRQRDEESAKTQILVKGSLNCYVVTGVYSNNGTLTGVHYKTEVKRPTTKLNREITAKVSIKSSVNVRCVTHFASHETFCDGKEHVFFYYDASHSNDPK